MHFNFKSTCIGCVITQDLIEKIKGSKKVLSSVSDQKNKDIKDVEAALEDIISI